MTAARVLLLAATKADAKAYLQEWPSLRSPALAVVSLRAVRSARGLHAGALFVTPEARKHPLFEEGVLALAPCFEPKAAALPPKSRPPRPLTAEYRRVGGGEAPRMRVPDPRGDGVRRAGELLRAGQVGQAAAVLRDAGLAFVKVAMPRVSVVDGIAVQRLVSMLPEAAVLAGQVVELPPPPPPVDDFEDLVDRDAGLPAAQRKHRGRPFYGGSFDPKCDVCQWDPQATGHAPDPRKAAKAIRLAHNPNGKDD